MVRRSFCRGIIFSSAAAMPAFSLWTDGEKKRRGPLGW